MKIFISWSGELSRQIAEALRSWLQYVVQATEPWISTQDIDKGSIWFSEITDQLHDTSLGIVCLTPENLKAPWILFEAGALLKGLKRNRVCTLLIDLKVSDLEEPLSKFNATMTTKEDMFKLVQTINKELGEKKSLPKFHPILFSSLRE
jgi:TIR domain